MYKNDHFRCIALAGLFQALELVRCIARNEEYDEKLLDITLKSILVVDADNPIKIYGDINNLSLGFEVLVQYLSRKVRSHRDISRYFEGILLLEPRIRSDEIKRKEMGAQIQRIADTLEKYTVTDEEILSQLAKIYVDYISELSPRIQVLGVSFKLKEYRTQYLIRALLLAAIRASFLWRQLGGKRRQFIFFNRHLFQTAHSLHHDLMANKIELE